MYSFGQSCPAGASLALEPEGETLEAELEAGAEKEEASAGDRHGDDAGEPGGDALGRARGCWAWPWRARTGRACPLRGPPPPGCEPQARARRPRGCVRLRAGVGASRGGCLFLLSVPHRACLSLIGRGAPLYYVVCMYCTIFCKRDIESQLHRVTAPHRTPLCVLSSQPVPTQTKSLSSPDLDSDGHTALTLLSMMAARGARNDWERPGRLLQQCSRLMAISVHIAKMRRETCGPACALLSRMYAGQMPLARLYRK